MHELDINKLQFKFDLEFGLKTAEDIQQWAILALEVAPSNELALDICFLSTPDEILNYFKNIDRSNTLMSHNRQIIYRKIDNYLTSLFNIAPSTEFISHTFQRLLSIAKYIEDDKLYDFVNHYGDEHHLALHGCSRYELNEIFPLFLVELKSWMKNYH
ncbi:hypothetical protein EAH57_04455 [Acinetobacter sp. 2JN-4]|uniref:hypothetical protein n=1 Tax=Acinetobacter sp. 2JN-4 TaxID=2479844 RepID=UPI000EF9CE2A|nr:hypothetical protein [Acinetobacter sp. 2JN-4]RLZ10243.1 hypothetical protein EAH57_04455 [Acinetobacter sp. 2JN-4]